MLSAYYLELTQLPKRRQCTCLWDWKEQLSLCNMKKESLSFHKNVKKCNIF